MPLRPTYPIADEGDHWHVPLPFALPTEVEGPNGYLNTMTSDCDSFAGYIEELAASLAPSGESSASSSQTSLPSSDDETETSSVETTLGPPLSSLLSSQAEVAGRAEPVTDIYWGENIVETGRATFACNFVDEEDEEPPPSRASSGVREAWSSNSPQKPRRLTDVLRMRLSRMMTKRSSRKVAPQASSGSQ